MTAESTGLLTGLLRDVSRSFYLTLRVLPGSVREQIGVAYLLARATDTVADTGLVPVQQRLEQLGELRRRIVGESHAAFDAGALVSDAAGTEGERALLRRFEEVVRRLDQFADADRGWIRDVLNVIIGGQELDLRRFDGGTPEQMRCLQTAEELDDYTFRVAGCVGEFWTRICRAHVFPRARLDVEAMVRDGIRFGQGLQLVNVLRDVAGDLRSGRCYFPLVELEAAGLEPAQLLDPSSRKRFEPVYQKWLRRAWEHLAVGWDYTCRLPPSCVRVRLACAWPLLIGGDTLTRLEAGNPLGRSRIKVSRDRVKWLMLKSLLLYPWRGKWEGMFRPREIQQSGVA